MILPSDKEYTQTKRIILGTERMKAEFLPLAEWIDKTYGVKTINIIYDIFDSKTSRIQVCFEFEKEKNKFLTHDISYFDKTKQKAIEQKFSEIVKQEEFSKNHNVFVVYGAFEPVARLEAIYKITQKQIEDFIKSFGNRDIWTVSIGFTVPTFFMFTEEKAKEYNKTEIKSILADKYYEFVKPFDEFNYFKRNDINVLIDSKENFDRNYESNWYYYYK